MGRRTLVSTSGPVQQIRRTGYPRPQKRVDLSSTAPSYLKATGTRFTTRDRSRSHTYRWDGASVEIKQLPSGNERAIETFIYEQAATGTGSRQRPAPRRCPVRRRGLPRRGGDVRSEGAGETAGAEGKPRGGRVNLDRDRHIEKAELNQVRDDAQTPVHLVGACSPSGNAESVASQADRSARADPGMPKRSRAYRAVAPPAPPRFTGTRRYITAIRSSVKPSRDARFDVETGWHIPTAMGGRRC